MNIITWSMTRREEKMKKTTNFLLIFILSLFVLVLSNNISLAGYLIELKNGRAIAVYDYKDTGEQIIFFSNGGEIIINKTMIKDIREAKFKFAESLMYEQENKEPVTGADKSKPGLQDLLTEELDNLYEQKESLAKEREELAKKQDELQNDIKQEGRYVLPTKRKEFKRRLDALEEKIQRFNEKVANIEKREETVTSKIEILKKEGRGY